MRRDLRTPLITFAACVLVAVVALSLYAVHRQQVTDARAEKQRQAICAILQNIPGHIPPEIANARRVFAKPGHPDDCDPTRHPTVKRHGSTVLVVPDGGGASQPPTAPRPSQTRTASPRPTPRPTHSPSPSPSPSPTCSTVQDIADHLTDCLHLSPGQENP